MSAVGHEQTSEEIHRLVASSKLRPDRGDEVNSLFQTSGAPRRSFAALMDMPPSGCIRFVIRTNSLLPGLTFPDRQQIFPALVSRRFRLGLKAADLLAGSVRRVMMLRSLTVSRNPSAAEDGRAHTYRSQAAK